ncbi:hypothetical protein [Actinoplanes sp. GCM10030250]|uniref:hypothetical protein n=1 Tax=Actinoplanes sp. GCM10030250 TaxID=3273376 RepID=UPI00361C4715
MAGLVGMVSNAGGHSGTWSTGSAECCVCPVCKVIAAMRDPSPETAEWLASSAGDIATGVAGLMRAFSGIAGDLSRPRSAAPRPATRSADSDGVRPGAARSGDPDKNSSTATRPADSDGVWSSATRSGETARGETGETPGDDPSVDPWAAVSAESAREAAAAAKARAAAAEQAVARAVEQARAAAAARKAGAQVRSGRAGDTGVPRTGSGSDVWAMATAEAAADDAASPRSVDHDLGASAPEDRDAAPGDGARAGDAV